MNNSSDYCILYLSRLRILNNKVRTILQNKPRHTHVIELYKTYNTDTVHDMHKFQILILVHFFHIKINDPQSSNAIFNIHCVHKKQSQKIFSIILFRTYEI